MWLIVDAAHNAWYFETRKMKEGKEVNIVADDGERKKTIFINISYRIYKI